ncbi:hypothetical protein FRC04_003995 [Tulasnella sp. 424]|nr:hypothetical protein FRC04_003995 [Tulasnella sp. 424]KAG8970591.1 hypothetical protein FRC05_000527 [Tulasnella sp. 425]
MTQTKTRPRSPSPASPIKRLRTDASEPVTSRFASGLLDECHAQRLHTEYAQSEPYKHIVIEQLFDDALLRGVKDEILGNIQFTEKETDIYKVNQTGDLASLSYLTTEQLALFPSLSILRDALYGAEFRQFLRTVTGCGPLSGSKQDMSINSYKKGCHLLNHDDVIGTRRVSYILYLPLPLSEPWKPSFGGALELYPTVPNSQGILEPLPTPSKVVPPSWNQFIFFEVQPGRSFHSVEEVVVEPGVDDRQRLSISGWFHKPQEGEEGWEPEDPMRDKSSLEQLSTSTTPLTTYPLSTQNSHEALTQTELSFLSDFIDPVYLSPSNLKMLADRFASESSLELHAFLRKDYAGRLETELRTLDIAEGFSDQQRQGAIPSHSSGVGSGSGWTLRGPPHKLRYCVLDPLSTSTTSGASIIRELEAKLFPSAEFRSWLRILSSLIPTAYGGIEARRFRPGLDYTLARSEAEDSRLDVVLGLTPPHDGWESGVWGGWDCYMAPHEGEEDPAVYRSGSGGKKGADNEEDGTLLVSQPGFNRLLVVLRDAGVLSFVKYVSAEAKGCRWDICGEWAVEDAEPDVSVTGE